MRTLSPSEYNTFERLVMLSQSELKQVASKFLKKNYDKVIETKEFIIAEGDIPIALIAHLDIIFDSPPKEVYFDRQKNVILSPTGLGADDRAGVYAIFRIIREGLHPHIIFTTDEEISRAGAIATAKLNMPFKDLKYIIELDRRGSNDCIFYNCGNETFINYIESFGFEWNYGTYADIYEICPSWEIAGVNLSIGYKDEHTTGEVLFVGQMLSTIEKVKNMLMDANSVKEPFKFIDAYCYPQNWLHYPSDIVLCQHCKKYYMEEETISVIDTDEKPKKYCYNCVDKWVAWCTECDRAYEKIAIEEPTEGICPICKKKRMEEKQNGTRSNS